MSTELTVSGLNGLFKEVYADRLKDLRLKGYVFQNDFDFMSRSKAPGGTYHQPVLIKHEHGFTYSPSGKGAFTLKDPIAGGTDDATVLGTQILLRSRLDYESAARAAGGRNAFKDATRLLVSEMVSARAKRLEIELLYGQHGIGKVSGIDGAGNYVTIDADFWAYGIWAGMEGAKIQFWNGTTERLGGVAAGTGAIIDRVDLDNKRIYLNSAFNVDETGEAVAANDFIFFHGARASSGETGYSAGDHKCFLGLHEILDAAASPSTDLFGIAPQDSSLWSPTNHDVAGTAALTFDDVQDAVVKAVGKGVDSDLTLYISPATWADLLSAEVAKREWNRRPARYEVGAEGIQFYGQNGTITIKASNYVMQSFGYLIEPMNFKRIGATDWTFNLPGEAENERFFIHLADSAAYELRTYTHQCLFSSAPGRGVLLSDIYVT